MYKAIVSVLDWSDATGNILCAYEIENITKTYYFSYTPFAHKILSS
jgi:hypothetical protein